MQTISSKNTQFYPSIIQDYLEGKLHSIANIAHGLNWAELQAKKEIKKASYTHRTILVEVLQKQYQDFTLVEEVKNNITALGQSNTFTITTGHQLSLFRGPMFFVTKILELVKYCDEAKNNNLQLVPVFWMATEDHDLAEINHFNLFGKKYEWDIEGKVATGRLSTAGLAQLFSQVPDFPDWLSACYTSSKTLSEATRKLVSHLFGQYGLVIVDGDDKLLKSLFFRQIEKDILETKYAPILRESTRKIEKAGYKAQAYVRECNFFYLGEGFRERIEFSSENEPQFRVLNREVSFTKQELQSLIRSKPELFSPNVLLRPLYQESILPNLAYVGGPGEIAYWFQLKDMFESENIPLPVLFPRKIATLVSKDEKKKMDLAGLQLADFFLNEEQFREKLWQVLQVKHDEFEEENALLESLKQRLLRKAAEADKSLASAVEAEMAKTSKSMGDLQKRLNKAHENRFQIQIKQLQKLRSKFLPEGHLQERHENFLNYYLRQPQLMELLHDVFQPFSFEMEFVVYD
ncbi:MAG TPA: bacillithiol biosynthesis cysteine-adding enzyme BshC [Cytophagales bacterium]|nr:bacillithiol biosynthesis cysteine-adding enzyme BshC [Cytophagales bacterium]